MVGVTSIPPGLSGGIALVWASNDGLGSAVQEGFARERSLVVDARREPEFRRAAQPMRRTPDGLVERVL